jgi:hypothetical protein
MTAGAMRYLAACAAGFAKQVGRQKSKSSCGKPAALIDHTRHETTRLLDVLGQQRVEGGIGSSVVDDRVGRKQALERIAGSLGDLSRRLVRRVDP